MKLFDIPNDPHWAIVTTEDIQEWDYRNEQYVHSHTVLSYTPYTTRENWESAVRAMVAAGNKFKAFSVGKAATITTTITVE